MTTDEMVTTRPDGDGVEIVVLRHPPVNALNAALLGSLADRFAAIEADPQSRCVVLTGDGAYFSAGADLKELAALPAADAPAVVARGLDVFGRIERVRVPVVAAINGLAVGGGLELALACDLRVAGESAKLGAPEVNYGLMPAYGGSQRLLRLVGPARARELIFTGHLLSAADALKVGLVNRAVPSGQELRAARDLAHTIASRAPRAVAAAKRALLAGRDRPLPEALASDSELFLREVLPTTDLVEGLTAFAERRPPKFKGE